jgi:PAS domain S-box-containing protein
MLVADQAPGLMWVSGPDRRSLWFNRAWLEFTGRQLSQEIGDGWIEGVHPDDRDRCLTVYQAAFDTRQPFTREYRLRRRDGEYRWLLDNGAPLRNQSQEFYGYVGSSVDITERRQAAEERAHLLQQAQTANRLKDEFMATLSHELRTPLNTVLGWTHLLRDGTRSEAEVKHALEVIERNVRAQSKLVDDVLDVSRMVSGKLRLELETVDIANVVQGVAGVLQPAADAKGVALSVDVRKGHGFVAGDAARLHQAIWNVVSNAVKFTRRGGSVTVAVTRKSGTIEIVIADTGSGIPPEFVPHLFERFSRAGSGQPREYGGLGLGLAIVKHLMELHGGSVSVESAGPDQGTTATLRLPLVAVHPAEVSGISAEASQPIVTGVRVLAVDDDADARGLVKEILESGGAVVTTVDSAHEALAAMARERFDVLVSDLAMPEADGCELMRNVRALPAERGGDIPAAALTAYARSEDRTRVLMAGFDLHVAKPIDPGELLAVVQSLAAKRTAP